MKAWGPAGTKSGRALSKAVCGLVDAGLKQVRKLVFLQTVAQLLWLGSRQISALPDL